MDVTPSDKTPFADQDVSGNERGDGRAEAGAKGPRTSFRERMRRSKDPVDTFRLRHFAGPARHAEQLDQLRIAHLTDLHVGRVTPMEVQQAAVQLTNASKPDLVVITGDFVCHSQLYLDDLRQVIDGFDAPVACVLGNHDHWSGGAEVKKTLEKAGAAVLSNQHTRIHLGHETLQLVGVDDAYTGQSDPRRATRGLDPKIATLGLSHIAEEADALWRLGVPLVLSGHTHAGQITVARLHELAVGRVVGHRYVHGLYGCRNSERDHGAVYVGAGVGAAVMPLRIGERAQREVALFDLGQPPAQYDDHHTEQSAHPGRKPSAKTRYRRAAAVHKKAAKRTKKNR